MAESHYAPTGLWPGAIGLDQANRIALASDFQGLIRQHNTLLSSGPPLFHWAGWVTGSGYLLWESCGANLEAIRYIGVAWNSGGSSNSLTLSAGTNTLVMDNAWFGDASARDALLDWPLTERLGWKLDYSVLIGDSDLSWLVAPVPFGSLAEPSLEGLGYIHDSRAASLYGVSRGTMQRMQDGIAMVRSRPLSVANLGWVPGLTVGKTSKYITPGQPFLSTGKSLVLAVHGLSESEAAEVRLLVDGTAVATLTGLPTTLQGVMQRTTASAALTAGYHTYALYVYSPAANTTLSSVSIYEVA